ncbi:MAG: hypothetical protein M1823_008820, partial [Watsoniomyces obsoletus]
MAGSQRVPAALSQVALKTRSSLFVCRSCRRELQNPPRPNAHQIRHAMTPFTKSLRKKIWGTDNPP